MRRVLCCMMVGLLSVGTVACGSGGEVVMDETEQIVEIPEGTYEYERVSAVDVLDSEYWHEGIENYDKVVEYLEENGISFEVPQVMFIPSLAEGYASFAVWCAGECVNLEKVAVGVIGEDGTSAVSDIVVVNGSASNIDGKMSTPILTAVSVLKPSYDIDDISVMLKWNDRVSDLGITVDYAMVVKPEGTAPEEMFSTGTVVSGTPFRVGDYYGILKKWDGTDLTIDGYLYKEAQLVGLNCNTNDLLAYFVNNGNLSISSMGESSGAFEEVVMEGTRPEIRAGLGGTLMLGLYREGTSLTDENVGFTDEELQYFTDANYNGFMFVIELDGVEYTLYSY